MTDLSDRGFSAKLPFKQLKENKIHVSADWALTVHADSALMWISDSISTVGYRSNGSNLTVPIRIKTSNLNRTI